MDQYDRIIGDIGEIDRIFSEKLATISLHKTNKLINTLENCVGDYKRTKNILIIKDFLKDLDSPEDDSFKENEQNKPNKESMRPRRKAQLKTKLINEEENKAPLLKNVKIEPVETEDTPVYYESSLVVKNEKEMIPGRRLRPKKEKIEVKEKKPSAQRKTKKAESSSRDSDVIYQPNEIVNIDITDEDINRNSIVSDADSIDGEDQSVRVTKHLQPKPSSKLKKPEQNANSNHEENEAKKEFDIENVASNRMNDEAKADNTDDETLSCNTDKLVKKHNTNIKAAANNESECLEMGPPALPVLRGRIKKEKISEVKERKQSTRTKKKKVESAAKEEVILIDNDTDEDVNRNIIISDVESVDDVDKSSNLTKFLKDKTNKSKPSKLGTTNRSNSKDQLESDSEGDKYVKSTKESEKTKVETQELQIQNTSSKEPEKLKETADININKQTDEQNVLNSVEVENQIIYDQTTNGKELEAKNTTMKIKPPRTKKTKAQATSETNEPVTMNIDQIFPTNTNAESVVDTTFAVTKNNFESNSMDTNGGNSTFLVSNKNTETNIANVTYATSTNNTVGNNDVNGTFVFENNEKNNSPQVNGTFVVNSNKLSGQNLNETHVVPNKLNQINVMSNTPEVNSTFVVGKEVSPVRKKSSCSVYEDALEHIQSEVKVTKGTVKKPVNKGPKPVFNPFENSPVKKKVEAFEKLGAESAVDSETRVTRTKTRNKAKAQQQESEKKSQIPVVESASRICTPSSSNRYLPSSSIYASCKTVKTTTHTTPIISAKTMSAIKASHQEFREREQRRKEKEEEAMRKKEQLLKAQIEEKKRKREERELKAKQQRDAQEKEKKKMLEVQAQKEEKLKRQQAEKQEKLMKMREEAEKKRQLVKQRNDELKRLEEETKSNEERRKLEEAQYIKQEEERMRKLEEKRLKVNDCQKVIPLYMTTKAPLLPTYDCYDSDDEEGQKKTAATRKPDFLRSEQMRETLRCMEYVDSKLKNTLFCLKPQTPNLREIFEIIDPKKLRRNSSAIWKHAPRFTLMPKLQGNEDDC